MNAVELVQRLHQHREWVNRKLMAAAADLSNERLQQSFEIGQGSIWKTLTHLYAAEYVWLEALQGNEDPVAPGDSPDMLPGNQEGDQAMTSLSELRLRWTELNERWKQYLVNLTPESLTQTAAKISSLSGRRSEVLHSDILMHICTHAQYTAAQAINMMRHVSVEPLPDAMLISLAREEVARSNEES